MKLSPLPFEALGQLSPILAWAEGDHGTRLPATWAASVPFRKRERSWLLKELPTYSFDNVNDIVRGSRSSHRIPKPVRLPFMGDETQPSLDPPPGYDLRVAFRDLNRYFFVWNGTELCIRKNRMEELHELGIRMPAGHIVRHGHARAVSEGVMGLDEALDLPELVTLLPSNSFGLRSVIRKGLSESHLHLKGVTSAEETWADNLLRPLSAHSIHRRSLDPGSQRLLLLNLFAGRLLALAVWMSFVAKSHDYCVNPRKLLGLLDCVYFARTPHEERRYSEELEQEIRRAVHGDRELWRSLSDEKQQRESARREGGEPGIRPLVYADVPKEYNFLLRWMAPIVFRVGALDRHGSSLPGSSPEGLRERCRFVHQLHLAAHLRLIQLTPRRWKDPDSDLQDASKPPPRVPSPQLDFLHQALFRYLVCRTHHWQQATQSGKTTGLRYFREFYGAGQRRPTGLTEARYAELVFERLREWRGLRVLEGRVGPPRSTQDLVPWILAYARPTDRRIEKFGLVVHFKKEDEEKEERGFSTSIPAPAPRLRWGRRRRRVRDEGLRLYRQMREPTPISPFVVGIDACNLELATPPEVFAPVFRYLREFPIALREERRRFSPYFDLDAKIRSLVGARRLGMTYHVGEDFRHLLSGLRAIHEVVTFLAPKPGDRLGHGTALALEPKDWLEHNGYQAIVPKLEWLDTLVWVHHFLGPGDNLVGELAIEDEIQRLSWQIYSEAMGGGYDPMRLSPGRSSKSESGASRTQYEEAKERTQRRGLLDWDWSPLALWDAWALRQLDPYSVDLLALFEGKLKLKAVGSSSEEARRWHQIQERVEAEVRDQIGSRNAYLLLGLYWLSRKVRKRGNEIVVVDMQKKRRQWLELCRRVEDRMRREIREHELVVEVNPSSNRIIGPMASYRQHHVFRLTLDEKKRLLREVRVSVNTDNPAVCNTTLAHEHYLLGEILLDRGVPEPQVIEWLDWLRTNGEEYNFARRLMTSDEDPKMKALMEWLRRIRPTVREARTPPKKYDAFWQWQRETRLRDQGFDPRAIEADAGALERLVAAEHQIRELRKQTQHAASAPAVAERLRRLEDELADLRKVTVV